MHRNTGKLTWHCKKSPSLSNVFVACLLMAIWHLSRDGVEKKERGGREREGDSGLEMADHFGMKSVMQIKQQIQES